MCHSPNLHQFRQLARQYDRIPVYRQLLFDTLTPVQAFRRLDTGQDACLFESVIGGEKVGRFSFLTAEPYQRLEAFGHQVCIHSPADTQICQVDDPFDPIRSHLSRYRVPDPAQFGLPPFLGGAVGYAAYDVVRYTERLPNPPEDDRHLPDLYFAFYQRMVIFDNVRKTLTVVALADVTGAGDVDRAYREAQSLVDHLVQRLSQPADNLQLTDIDTSGEPTRPYESDFTRSEYEQAVERAVEYIRAGDVFQVVLSQRLATHIHSDPFEIYRTLRVVNPSPFMFFLRTPMATLVGSSPEIMCRVMHGTVTVRPLAGTRRRGRDEREDRRLAEELLADPKERAEHVMLVDLGRNDVGRVARYGTVQLSDVMTIERYSHVMHITSNVTGQLAPAMDAFDALKACLPAGTVSGAPKVRAMEIIDELERHRRGPYAGAVGYIDFSGNMDTCIALRTLVVQNQIAYVQAGAGIVADSVPALEYQETLNKAHGLLKAIEITEQRTRIANNVAP